MTALQVVAAFLVVVWLIAFVVAIAQAISIWITSYKD